MPTQFQLLNHTIRVKENPVLKETDKFGQAEYEANRIHLHPNLEHTVKHHTFCHELFHFLFYYAGRLDLAQDETLIDVMAGLLAQYESTKR